MRNVDSDPRVAAIAEMQIDRRETIPRQLFTDDFENAGSICRRLCEAPMMDPPQLSAFPDRFL